MSDIDVRNARILTLRGQKSSALIARDLGISRSTVAGVCFRADWPLEKRIAAPGSGRRNKSGTGHHGGFRAAAQTLWDERRAAGEMEQGS